MSYLIFSKELSQSHLEITSFPWPSWIGTAPTWYSTSTNSWFWIILTVWAIQPSQVVLISETTGPLTT
jgi:hypothetical protein